MRPAACVLFEVNSSPRIQSCHESAHKVAPDVLLDTQPTSNVSPLQGFYGAKDSSRRPL